ncbi:hypothetical protein EYC80_002376 [Monilinia laxa]|uniref:Secreted protein n=1 Tax=Monilinia laxa TaxID=61186 RepID=A0A5N6K3L7_MONLA|nr:hypothetical protein EYC80_002376 [Monilinia laxa]
MYALILFEILLLVLYHGCYSRYPCYCYYYLLFTKQIEQNIAVKSVLPGGMMISIRIDFAVPLFRSSYRPDQLPHAASAFTDIHISRPHQSHLLALF